MKTLNTFIFLASVGLLGLLPYFLPELFPSRSFVGNNTRAVWGEFIGFLATCFAASPGIGKLIAARAESPLGFGGMQAA